MKENELFSISVSSGRGALLLPHFHADAMEFFEVVKGAADVTVGRSVIRVPEGGILHILPGVLHFASAAREEECLVRTLTYRQSAVTVADHLDEEIISLYLLPIGSRAALFTDEHSLHPDLSRSMEIAISEWRGKEIFYTASILAEIARMTAAVLRSWGYREEESLEYRNRMRVAPTVRYIESHYAERLRLEDLAATLYLSPDHFGKLFRSTVGLTPIEYINNVRVDAAMRLLASTDAPIAEISSASGFANANYFHKVFHDLVGVGPAALRKRWRAIKMTEKE